MNAKQNDNLKASRDAADPGKIASLAAATAPIAQQLAAFATNTRADDIPGDLTPEWGLHLVDVNLVMGDVVRQVAAQSDAWSGD